MRLTDSEFWRLRGLIDAHGEEEVAKRCKMTVEQLCSVIYPGGEDKLVERVRHVLPRRP